MTLEAIERYLALADAKVDQHGCWGKWGSLRNNLRRERKRALGRADREGGNGCTSWDGCYLEGYHDKSDARLYYVTWEQLKELV